MNSDLSLRSNCIIIAHEKGYKIVNGEAISPFSGKSRAIEEVNGCLYFSIRTGVNAKGKWKNGKVNVARLVGYNKFGNEIFEEGRFVFHKDGDIKNNSYDNICIGTMTEAQMSKKEEVRIASATKASPKKHDHVSCWAKVRAAKTDNEARLRLYTCNECKERCKKIC